jgi:hypothetical protein
MAGRTGFGRPPTRFGGSWLVCEGYPTRFGGSRPVSEGCPTRFEGSRPVSEGCPMRFGGSRGPGKLDDTGAPGFWGRFLGAQGGRKGANSQVTEDWRSTWICGSVDKKDMRTVGKRSKLYPSQPDGPWQAGAGGLIV